MLFCDWFSCDPNWYMQSPLVALSLHFPVNWDSMRFGLVGSHTHSLSNNDLWSSLVLVFLIGSAQPPILSLGFTKKGQIHTCHILKIRLLDYCPSLTMTSKDIRIYITPIPLQTQMWLSALHRRLRRGFTFRFEKANFSRVFSWVKTNLISW